MIDVISCSDVASLDRLEASLRAEFPALDFARCKTKISAGVFMEGGDEMRYLAIVDRPEVVSQRLLWSRGE